MNRDIFWRSLEGVGIEHLRLSERVDGIYADSWVIGQVDDQPFRLHYTLICDSAWKAQSVTAAVLSPTLHHVELTVSDEGVWSDGRNNAIEELDGCIDIDISATPFTNTLPLRRLKLKAGEAAIIEVAYLSVPDLEWRISMQRYECLAQDRNGSRYRFESLRSGFTTEITVDSAGLVTHYPELFERVK